MASRGRSLLLVFSLATLLIAGAATKSTAGSDDDEEDLSFLEEDDVTTSTAGHHDFDPDDLDDFDPEAHNYGDHEDDEDDEEGLSTPSIDEKDVLILTDGNFSEFLKSKKHVMVEFYASWCGHCQALAPEYAAAATALKEAGDDVALAKVDATEENEIAQQYEIQGFPTVMFFVDGAHIPYPGARTKDAIVQWIKKKIGPAIKNVTTTAEAEKILTSESKLVLGFLDSLVGADSEELAAASKLEDDVSFYQTINPDVAKLFHIDPKAKRPSLVMLKKEAEKVANFVGQFTKSAILEFISANKLPLVNVFTREAAPSIFESPIKKQLLLFAPAKGSDKVLPAFEEAAQLFKGKLLFVYVEMDNEDFGRPVSDYFGVTGDDLKVLAFSGNEDAKKYILDGEATLDNLKTFAEGFLEDKLKPFYKSEPVPETNDGDVKIVVGNNFDEIVLDESKDVLLEIYAPWCGHCQALEPIYNKLAKHLHGIDSLVIAKMDGTTNEHPRAKGDGFPTLLFFPAGKKSFDPITVDTDRTVVAFYKYVKKHASIPFKLQKPSAETKWDSGTEKDVKDEL